MNTEENRGSKLGFEIIISVFRRTKMKFCTDQPNFKMPDFSFWCALLTLNFHDKNLGIIILHPMYTEIVGNLIFEELAEKLMLRTI